MENNVIGEIIKITHLLRRQVGCGDADFHERIGMTGIRMVRYLMDNREKDTFQKDLEVEFSLRASSVSVTLKKLENKGFITREAVEHDARLKRIVLTDKLSEMHDEKSKQYDEIEKKINDNMTEQEIKQLDALLLKLSEILE
ncbi:MAG: MarR family transcriptional regulator [Peptostreptococcaceae bacterium]|nr:MarR family transcriptional regulator [Peptostreptococcaceae bacterium]